VEVAVYFTALLQTCSLKKTPGLPQLCFAIQQVTSIYIAIFQ